MKKNFASKKGFTLIEILVVMVIIGILSTIGIGAFQSSQMKSRDARRKADLRHIAEALEAYYNDMSSYPSEASFQALLDTGAEFAHTEGTIYMVNLPVDPGKGGTTYDYDTTDGSDFQLYALLENTDDRDVPKDVSDNPQTYLGTSCPSAECNFGISSSNTNVETGHTPH